MSLQKVRIGFDLDGIFIDSPPFIPKRIIEKLYKRSDNALSYRIPGKAEQKIRVLSHFPIIRPPIKKNISSLIQTSKNKDINLYLISSRFSFLKKRTSQWDEKNKLLNYFKKVFFNDRDEQPHLFKNRVIREEKIEKFIDDDIDLLKYLAKENPKVEFFWLNPGNNSRTDLPQNIKIIKNLEEFSARYL